MIGRHRILALLFAAVLLLSLAGEALAAPAPSYSETMSVSRSCLLSGTVGWKNTKAVGSVYFIWYEAGYVNPSYPTIPDYVATSAWPATGPNAGVQKGSTVTFTFGPIPADTINHSWYGLAQFYDTNGASITQAYTNTLSTRCFV